MTLTELMNEIQEKYQHSLSNESVIRKLDAIQKRIYRIHKKLVRTELISAPGQIFFEPKYRTTDPVIRPGDIREFIVDNVSYPYRDIEDEDVSKYFFYIDGKYGVFPKPEAGTKIVVMHYYTPVTLTTASTGVEIEEEFQNILVYGTCKEIAESYQDFDVANGYAVQYNFFLEEFLKYNRPMEPATIREEWWG